MRYDDYHHISRSKLHDSISTSATKYTEGKVALISGSSQGFGRGIPETFVRGGAVDGYTEQQAYQIKANVAEEQSWKRVVGSLIEPMTLLLF
jgi:NADP-dependent 3-hydroxy acid dehydrogenase YdfG